VRICVSDTGRGINAQQVKSLFQPFNRLGLETSKIEGTGIGLTISKKLVELMHGTLSVTSEEGRGSQFTVELDTPGDQTRA
jgi:signal transduction histidine kinase